MRHITTLLILIFSTSIFAQNNVVKTAGVSYTAGPPTFTPGRTGSQVAIDTVTGFWYEHNGTSWSASGYRVQTISGCAAPAYTPAKYQSRLVINACTAGQGGPELYYYTGSVWLQINEGQTYTAGTGIDITGTTITNTAPNVAQTLSIAGQYITLSGGGGTVEIPTGKDTVYVVLSGQSNAWGATPAFQGDTTSSTKVQVWNGAYWARAQIGQLPFRISSNNPSSSAYNNSNNLGLHFCKKLSEYTGQIVRLILSPFDGNSITNWIPTGSTNFTSLNGQVSAAGVSRIDIFLWHQGEADNAQTNSWYVSKFDTLKQQLRAESWFPVKTPIIVGGLLVGGIQSGQDAALQAIGESSDPWVAYASSAGLVNNGIDNVHFSGSSLVVFGDSIYWKSYLSLPRTVTTIAEPLYQTVFGTTAGVTSDPRNTYNSSTGKQRYSETGTAGYTEIDKSIVQNPDTTQTLQSLHRINSGKSSPYAYAPYDRKFQYIAQIGPYQNYVFTDGYNSLSDAQPIQSAKPMYQKSIYTSIIEGGVPKFGIYDRFRAPDSNAVILSGYTINYKNAFNPSATPYFDYSQAIDRYRLIAPTTGQPFLQCYGECCA